MRRRGRRPLCRYHDGLIVSGPMENAQTVAWERAMYGEDEQPKPKPENESEVHDVSDTD